MDSALFKGNPTVLLTCTLALLQSVGAPAQHLQAMWATFQNADTNADGFVSRGEVAQWLRTKASDQAINIIMDIVDFRRIGVVSYAGLVVADCLTNHAQLFKKILKKSPQKVRYNVIFEMISNIFNLKNVAMHPQVCRAELCRGSRHHKCNGGSNV